jgi:hypothetical protein
MTRRRSAGPHRGAILVAVLIATAMLLAAIAIAALAL